MSNTHGGYSRRARQRRKRAALLSQRMRQGDGRAALSLLKRRHALQGIAKRGWGWRLRLATQASAAKRKLQKEEREAEATRIAALQERKSRERDMAMERAHKQAMRELEARRQMQRPGRS